MIVDTEMIAEMVRKMVGRIEPVGDASRDDARFDSLVEMTDVIDRLLRDVEDVACIVNVNSPYSSVKKAGRFAQEWLEALNE